MKTIDPKAAATLGDLRECITAIGEGTGFLLAQMLKQIAPGQLDEFRDTVSKAEAFAIATQENRFFKHFLEVAQEGIDLAIHDDIGRVDGRG